MSSTTCAARLRTLPGARFVPERSSFIICGLSLARQMKYPFHDSWPKISSLMISPQLPGRSAARAAFGPSCHVIDRRRQIPPSQPQIQIERFVGARDQASGLSRLSPFQKAKSNRASSPIVPASPLLKHLTICKTRGPSFQVVPSSLSDQFQCHMPQRRQRHLQQCRAPPTPALPPRSRSRAPAPHRVARPAPAEKNLRPCSLCCHIAHPVGPPIALPRPSALLRQ
ncbi:hypothetical protein B0T18DRAFT_216334 [Schizothecium vesticola]|uniref:Uncharacterized protein n=1 Tax=Schizothecium vesticola TaxID=314040 RepID=A0AA40EK69_9PEZI|nr:hypothetical protein B0T18DRAFT_216334 [Schizothecium vesticola]